jgi:hypothetical protein
MNDKNLFLSGEFLSDEELLEVYNLLFTCTVMLDNAQYLLRNHSSWERQFNLKEIEKMVHESRELCVEEMCQRGMEDQL